MSARALRFVGFLGALCLFGCGSEPQSGARLGVSVDGVPDPTGQADYLLDFGAAVIGDRVLGVVPVAATGAAVEVQAHSVLPPFFPDVGALALEPGRSGELRWTFRPQEVGDFSTVTRVTSSTGAFTVRLVGAGFDPGVTCTPSPADLGPGYRGQQRHLEVVCAYAAPPAWAPVVGPIEGEDRFDFTATATPGPGRLVIDVAVNPDRIGQLTAALPLRSEGGQTLAELPLRAVGIDRALACNPAAVDFGFVQPGLDRHVSLVCTNASGAPIRLTGIALEPSPGERFSWSPNTYPIEVPAQGQATLDLVFGPRVEDAGLRKSGLLVLHTDDSATPRLEVPLTGFAGGPSLACSPEAIDFGTVATGTSATRTFACTNNGWDDPTTSDDRLYVYTAASSWSEFTDEVPGGLDPRGYDIGETFTVEVTYAPADDGVDGGAVRFSSNAIDPDYQVALQGHGVELPACDVDLVPPALRFGLVPLGSSATLEFAVRNRRPDAGCVIQDLRLAPSCDPAFSLPAGDQASSWLPAGGELRVPLRFAPTRRAASSCDVTFDVSDPGDPHRTVHASGSSADTCLALLPYDLDFGPVRPGCASRERELRVLDTCATPVTLGTIERAEGASDEFVLRYAAPAGTVVQPGREAVVAVLSYRPADEGPDVGAVLIGVQGAAAPNLATVRGRASSDASVTDRFDQLDRPKVDVLWVMDNSGGMLEEQASIAANVTQFLSFAQAQAIDYHVGVTTSGLSAVSGCNGGANGGESGRLFPVDHSSPRIVTPSTPNPAATLASNLQVGTCHFDAYLLDAAWRALNPPLVDACDDPRFPAPDDGNCGFLRRDAHLSIIAVTDGAEPAAGTVDYYYQGFLALKNGHDELFSFHAITGDPGTGCNGAATGAAEPGDKLVALANRTEGGLFRSICTNDWATTLRDVSAAAFGYRTCYVLTALPEDSNASGTVTDTEGELEVRLNGTVTPSTGPQGQPYWEYRQDRGAVCFYPLAVPESGTQIEIGYRVACLGG